MSLHVIAGLCTIYELVIGIIGELRIQVGFIIIPVVLHMMPQIVHMQYPYMHPQ